MREIKLMADNKKPNSEYDESWYKIEDGDEEAEARIVGKAISTWSASARYWEPHLALGQQCWDAVEGKIFSSEERQRYLAEEKDPVEVPTILPKLRNITGQQRLNRKDGVVVAQGGNDAPNAYSMNIILKAIRQQCHLDQERSTIFKNGIVTGFPQFVFIERNDEALDSRKLEIYSELWNAVLPDPKFKRMDMSDMQYLIRVRQCSKWDLMAFYPDRADKIQESLDQMEYSWDVADHYNSDNRNYIMDTIQASQSSYEESGLVTVIERYFFINKVQTVYIRAEDEDNQILPEDWSKQRVQKWIKQNPDYIPVQKKIKTLWITSCTTTGVLLENKPHWFQEGRFNAAMYIPAMDNNRPTGWVESLVPSQKMNSVGRTEYVHSLRFANDKLMIVKESTLSDPEDAAIEKTKVGGIITVTDDSNIATDIQFAADQRGHEGYVELSTIASSDMESISGVHPGMLGYQESANETALRMDFRVKQGQVTQGEMIDNFNLFDQQLHKTILDVLPYVIDDYCVFRYVDEKSNAQEVEVNKPEGYNPLTGEADSWVNKLDAGTYDYVVGQGDNSITGREHELQRFLQITSQVLPQVPQSSWGSLLRALPDKMAQDFGKELDEQAQAQQEAIANGTASTIEPSVSFSLNGQDLQTMNPLIIDILKKGGILSKDLQMPEMPVSTLAQVKEAEKLGVNPQQLTEMQSQTPEKNAILDSAVSGQSAPMGGSANGGAPQIDPAIAEAFAKIQQQKSMVQDPQAMPIR